jgi:hypothetical protein
MGRAGSHLQEHLFHVREPQLLFSRPLDGPKRMQLAASDLVLLELVLGFEKRLHVPDEGFAYLGRQFDGFGHNPKGCSSKGCNFYREKARICRHAMSMPAMSDFIPGSL